MQDKHRHELTLLSDVTSDGTLVSIEALNKKYTEVLICITHPDTGGFNWVLEGRYALSDGKSGNVYVWGHVGGAVGGSRGVSHCDVTHTLCTSETYKMPTTYHAPSETDRRVYRWIESEGVYIGSFYFTCYADKYIKFPAGTRIQIYVANVEED